MTIDLDENSAAQESAIVSRFKQLFPILGRRIVANVILVIVTPTYSIEALCMWENVTGLASLVDLYERGKLHSMLEEVFTSLLVTDDPQERVHIKKLVWELSDYNRCSTCLNALPQSELLFSVILLLVVFLSIYVYFTELSVV